MADETPSSETPVSSTPAAFESSSAPNTDTDEPKEKPKPPKRKTMDVYDEEFQVNMGIAKSLIDRLVSHEDKAICKKWIIKVCKLKSTDVGVKRNRNSFFKYFLQVLHKSINSPEELQEASLNTSGPVDNRKFTCRWSPDKRTYVAAQPLPGMGTLVYMAVSKDPSLGWDLDGATAYV